MAMNVSLLLLLSLLLASSAYSSANPFGVFIGKIIPKIISKPKPTGITNTLLKPKPKPTGITNTFVKKRDEILDIIDLVKDYALHKVANKSAAPPVVSTTGLVMNGGFEVAPIAGWDIMGVIKGVKYIDSKHFNVPSGSHAIELVAGRASLLMQVITTVPDKEYQLSFIVGDAKNGCHGDMNVTAIVASDFQEVKFKSDGKGDNKEVSFSFKADSDKTGLAFFSSSNHTKINDHTLCGPVIDEVKVLPK